MRVLYIYTTRTKAQDVRVVGVMRGKGLLIQVNESCGGVGESEELNGDTNGGTGCRHAL